MFNLIFCLLILIAYNYSFWHQALAVYPLNLANLPFLFSIATFVTSVHYGLLSLVNFKYLLKPILLVLLFLAAISAYAMDTYGYLISNQAYQNLLATHSKEIFDLLTLKLSLYLVVLFVIPSVIVLLVKIKYPTPKQLLVCILITLLLIVTNLAIFNKNYVSMVRNHKHIHYYLNPVRPVYVLIRSIAKYYKHTSDTALQILDPNPALMAHTGKPRLVVLVIGEADRALNHSLNGYTRLTNPLLAKRKNIYSFNKFYSCGTETSISVPCMFSAFKREEFTYSKGKYTENVLDILQKSHVQVLWRDNDGGCKNVCDRVATEDFNEARLAPFCNGFECHDEILLHELQNYIDHNTGDKLIVLHKKGNHGPAYYKRYPAEFEIFTPVCKSNELQDCSQQEIINAYDNIIVYTDYFLDKLITQLESNANTYQTAMIYVADHGESLGEHGIYLHAMPYWLAPKEQLHVPFIFWASDDFAVADPRHADHFSHDNLFHTILGMFKVQTPVYERELDLFKEKT